MGAYSARMQIVQPGSWIATPDFFRLLTALNPIANGLPHQVLHGSAGSPTWSPVSLADDVSGLLPVDNGGTGIAAGISGGILAFTGPATIASSGALTHYGIVLGGGPGAAPSALAALGTTTQLLHGNAAGAPSWGSVVLTADVTGTLPVVNGGTGVTTATGTGSVVRATSPSISGPIVSGGLFAGYQAVGEWTYYPFNPIVGAHFDGVDTNVTSVTAVATTILAADKALFFVVHDKTSGGMSVGVMDTVGGVVIISAGVAGIAFTRLAGTGLQAAVTAGANPRSLSVFSYAVGP